MMAVAVLMGVAAVMAAGPKVVAHRGYWKADGSAQNSLRSLAKADSVGCYGSEFDVWMTVDSVLVVNHDPTVNGIRIETSDSKTVLAQRLSNGETVPTLESYLTAAESMPIRLVCELKTHNDRSREKLAVKEILKMVKEHGLEDRTDYIAFSADAFRNFIKEAPEGTAVYYLNGDFIPGQIKAFGGAGLDYSIKVMRRHPEWIKEAHDLGLLVNIWTVDSEEDMQWCIDQGADFITTNHPEQLQLLLK